MAVDVVACPHRGCVDLVDSRAGSDSDPLHLTAAEFVEFINAVKAGRFDDMATATAAL